MVKQFLVALVALLAIMVAVSLAVGSWKLPSIATPIPSPTGSGPHPTTTSASTPVPGLTATPEATASYGAPPPKPFTVSGRGSESSPPFQLTNLDYEVTYNLGGRCRYSAVLNSTDGTYSNGNLIADPIHAGPSSGLYHLQLQQPGTYLVAISTDPGCPWSLTFAAQ